MENIQSRKLICVEGRDEVYFFTAIFRYMGLTDIEILDFEGKGNFKPRIAALKLRPGFDRVTHIALIRDADSNPPESAFTSLTAILTNNGYSVPGENQSYSEGTPRVGVFIMPGNDEEGELEDLCLRSIYTEEVFGCINKYIECIGTKLRKESKAKVLCYLASQEPIINSLGLAAEKGFWDFDNEAFNDLKSFLEHFR